MCVPLWKHKFSACVNKFSFIVNILNPGYQTQGKNTRQTTRGNLKTSSKKQLLFFRKQNVWGEDTIRNLKNIYIYHWYIM